MTDWAIAFCEWLGDRVLGEWLGNRVLGAGIWRSRFASGWAIVCWVVGWVIAFCEWLGDR